MCTVHAIVQLCVNNISMVICSVCDFKPLKCQLPRRLIIHVNYTIFLCLDYVMVDIKLFKMVCFDPKLHFFENNRKNTEIRIKSFIKLDRKVHIPLFLTPKLAL